MKNLRIVARAIVRDGDKILLVRNEGSGFWYPPGGGWEHHEETILECAVREVKEESGYTVEVERLLWTQEFHESRDNIFFETFWLANLSGSDQPSPDDIQRHIDADPNGAVEEVRWFTLESVQDMTVFPSRIKDLRRFIDEQADTADPFIGVF